uniref:Protein kinase domain-containing protein n=1 Tax=Heterorhabditis bacteriophora TaxID=37862 RepID=A0A1I7XIR0_HETBA
MFEGPVYKLGLDPDSIGSAHSRLAPLGFDRRMWHVLGECFAEVMFMQDCIRAYPHAPSAWSLLSVAMTDKMYASGKSSSLSTQPILFFHHHPTFDRIPRVQIPNYKKNISKSLPQSSIIKDEDQPIDREHLCIPARKYVKHSSLEHDKPYIFKRQQSDFVIFPHTQSRIVPLTPVMRETAIEPPNNFKKYVLPITHNL